MEWTSRLRSRLSFSRSRKGCRQWGGKDDLDTMDPLSITVATIAILELSNKIVHGLKRVYKAPDEVTALSNEIVDLRLVFETAEEAIRDSSVQYNNPDLVKGLITLTKRTEATLVKIEAINEKLWPIHKVNSNGQAVISRTAWLKERGTIRELRQQLRETRHNVHAALSAMTSAKINATYLTFQTSVADLKETMIEGFDAHQEQLRAMQSTPDSAITDTAAEVEPFKRERSLSTTTTLVSVATTKAVTGCDYPCPCQCHIRSSYETPTWLKTAFGVLFASYAGSPVWGRQPCNYRPCMRSGASQTSYTWHFPTWMIAKAVAFSFSRSSLTGLGGSWSLHIPKSLAGDNPVWRFLNYGTVPQLVDVMSSGVASPCDMNEDGKSLLHGVNSSFQDGAGITASMMAYSKVTPASATTKQALAIESLHRIFHSDETFEYLNLSPLHLCMANYPESMFAPQITLNFMHINEQDVLGRTPLVWAASSNKTIVAKILLEWNADVSLVDKQQKSALHWAMISQSFDVAKLLLEHKANTELKDIFGRTPLHEVAKVANSEHLINLLLDHGANIDAEDYGFKRTPLHLAAYHGRADNLRALAACGADIECPTTGHRTALLDAIAYNRLPTVKALLELGADLNAVDSDGRTVLHLAASFGSMDIIDELSSTVTRSGAKTTSVSAVDKEGKTARENYYDGRKRLYYGEINAADVEEQAFLLLVKVWGLQS
ncbi:hypothetical protein NW766_007671 [Fusarium irregulare]|uniref:Ankyrin repeat protein n=1 Tax=Fusarium irregulare TaxID=2494466 RepID=A0A9W8PLM6_9HYPO|nr:hypothetical protein NW766_007671 [Fusarium irregulare]